MSQDNSDSGIHKQPHPQDILQRKNLKKTQDGTSICSEATTRVETTTNLLIINIEGELAVLQVEYIVPFVALIGNAQARANVCTRHMSVSCLLLLLALRRAWGCYTCSPAVARRRPGSASPRYGRACVSELLFIEASGFHESCTETSSTMPTAAISESSLGAQSRTVASSPFRTMVLAKQLPSHPRTYSSPQPRLGCEDRVPAPA